MRDANFVTALMLTLLASTSDRDKPHRRRCLASLALTYWLLTFFGPP